MRFRLRGVRVSGEWTRRQQRRNEERQRLVEQRTELLAADCDPCRRRAICITHRSFSLVSKEQLDEPMWQNPYVHCGYRPTELPPLLCLKSLFQLNNETVNIWSHLLGLLYFTWCQLYDNAVSLPLAGALLEDHIVFGCSALCFQVCMLLSACYHIFGCTSPLIRQWWLRLDVMGISSGLLGMYLSGIFYAFYCFPTWLCLYLTLFALLMGVTLVTPLNDEYMTAKYFNRRMGVYHFVYTAVVLYGFIPTVHWVALEGGVQSLHVARFLPNVLIVYGLTGLAFLFYASMVPERWKPGHFDIFGWSHQWWHLLILVAMIWWRRAGLELLEFHRSQTETCQTSL